MSSSGQLAPRTNLKVNQSINHNFK